MGTPSEPVDEVAAVKDAAKSPKPVDTILAVSRYADGTPRQSDGFKSVNPEVTAAISEQQLRQIAVSAVDHEMRSALAAAEAPGEPQLDPLGKALKDAHEKAEKSVKVEKIEGV